MKITAGNNVSIEAFSKDLSKQGIGIITSGTFSPTLDQPIAMGYVRQDKATPGLTLEIDIRGR